MRTMQPLMNCLGISNCLRCILQGMMAGWPSEEGVGLLGPSHPSLLRARYAGDERFQGHCGRKDYFVVIKRRRYFELCGFDPTKIYEIEGNWFYDAVWPRHLLFKLLSGRKINTELVPRCPKRGSHGHPHGRRSENDSGYRCPGTVQNFLKIYHGEERVGSGCNQLIKAPMMRLWPASQTPLM